MDKSRINEDYSSDKPQSYGGKYRLNEIYDKKAVDEALLTNDI